MAGEREITIGVRQGETLTVHLKGISESPERESEKLPTFENPDDVLADIRSIVRENSDLYKWWMGGAVQDEINAFLEVKERVANSILGQRRFHIPRRTIAKAIKAVLKEPGNLPPQLVGDLTRTIISSFEELGKDLPRR